MATSIPRTTTTVRTGGLSVASRIQNHPAFYMLDTDVLKAYMDARVHKRGSRSQLLFELHLEDHILKLLKELENGTYKPGRSMCFIIQDPVKREVFAASFRDRVVHHLVYNAIAPVLESKFIFDSYSCRIGKGTLQGIERFEHHIRSCSDNFTRDAYVLKLDISGYFMSIDREVLYRQVLNMLDGEDFPHRTLVLSLVKELIFLDPTRSCYRKGHLSDWDGLPANKSLFCSPDGCGLPIGNLTSQLFSNVYLTPLDEYIKRTLKCRHYGRYVDDFYIVHNSQEYLRSIVPLIRQFLHDELHLELHPRKVFLQNVKYGVTFLGARIKPYRRYVSQRTLRNLTSKFAEIPDMETPEEIRAVMNSYLGYMSHFKSSSFRRDFVETHPWLYSYGWFDGFYTKMGLKQFFSGETDLL